VEAVKAQMRALPNYSLYCRTQRVTLAEHDPVRRYLVGHFLGTAVGHRCQYSDDVRRAPRFDVVRVEQLRNPRLQDLYVAGLQQMAGLQRQATPMQLDALQVQTFGSCNQNEFLLYHGAPSDTCEHLALQGLDPRYAGCHRGKMFGVGTYLASNSSKSDLYTKPNAAGERCVLVVRAALGEAHVEKLETVERAREVRRWLMPPQRADGKGPLSSVVAATRAQGGAVDHPEFVVYDGNQTLPQFAIWYRHSPDCFCTHCVTEKFQIEHPLSGTCFTIPAEFVPPQAPGGGVAEVKSSVRQIKQAIFQMRGMRPEAQKLLCGAIQLHRQFDDDVEVRLPVGRTIVLECTLIRRATPSALLIVDLPGDHFFIRVLFAQGRELASKFQVSPTTTVKKLKRSIKEYTGTLTEHQRLVWQGVELTRDEETLDTLRPDNRGINATFHPVVHCYIRLPLAPQ